MRLRARKCPGQVHTARTSLSWEWTQASLNPKFRLFSRPIMAGASHMHTRVCTRPCPRTCTHLPTQRPAGKPLLPRHSDPCKGSSACHLPWVHRLPSAMASHTLLSPRLPARLEKTGRYLPSSTPAALAPSLPPQALVPTLAPRLQGKPGS